MKRMGKYGEEVICYLTVKSIRKYDNGDTCNVSFITPNGLGVGFVIENTESYNIGQKVLAIGINTHVSTAACQFRLVPFWNGEE
jgi:hypothetical protein